MNAKKLPSGMYRARLFLGEGEDGKKHYKSFTAKTKREAEKMALNYEESMQQSEKMTFSKAFDDYIESKSNVLSPSTLRGYKQMENYYDSIKDKDISEIDQTDVTRLINNFAGNHSPKTVRNCYSLLCAVIRAKIPDASFNVTMPQKEVLQYYIPKDSELKELLSYTREHNYDLYIAILLASTGTMRRSEVCGLSADDIKGCVVHVHNVMVLNEHREWVLKSVAKNSTSDRYIEYPQKVIDELPKKGMICKINPDRVSVEFHRSLKKLGLPNFRFHDLRHYAATIMHAMGIPEAYIMERGGWKTNTVLNQVYRGTRSDFSKKYSDKTNEYFDKML